MGHLVKSYKHMFTVMNISILIIIILNLSIDMLYAQKKASIQPLSPQQTLASNNQDQPKFSPEYEQVLKEYEKLIQKYPDKKELFYNMGNLNYLGGDSESALKNYSNALSIEDPEKKAHALYNMGNVYYNQGELQKSMDFFKEALQLIPDDEDIRHNYELSKLMLEELPPQQKKDQNNEGKEGDETEQNKQQSQPDNEDEQKKESESSQTENEDGEKQEKSSEEEKKEEKQSEESQSNEGKEKQEKRQDQQSQPNDQEQKDKQLGKEEAEAILNSLKANESNMKQKKYKAVGRIKLEKDW